MVSSYKHFDIHTESPDWKFVAILNVIASAGLGVIALLGLPHVAQENSWTAIVFFALMPFWLLGVAGTFHFLFTS